MEQRKVHDIVQRSFDKKFVVWSQVDDPFMDLDFYKKNGVPAPRVWVPIAVEFTKEAAIRASRESKI